MKRKKIAFIIPSLESGGAERVVSTLANALIIEFDVTIIAFYNCIPFYKLDSRIDFQFCNNEYKKEYNSILTHFQLFNKTYKILKSKKFNIVIGFMLTANIYAIILSKLLHIPNIISERSNPHYNSISNFWILTRRFLYPFADKLVIQTNKIKNYFKVIVKDEKIEIIYNPIAKDLLLKRDLTFAKKRTILNVGRLSPSKNQDLLIKAFANIEHDNWKLDFVGEGEYKKELSELIRIYALEDKITLFGNEPDIYKYYNSASIFVFTSKHEGFPNALTEALFFGVPCISTNCEFGPSELIDDSVNGFLIPVGDQKELEDKLTLLMNDSDLRQKFSANGIKSTMHYEASTISLQWKSLITKLLTK